MITTPSASEALTTPAAILREVGKALTSKLDLQELLQALMNLVAELFEPQDWSLMMVDEERNELFFAIVVGRAAENLAQVRLKMGEGVAGWVAEHGTMLATDDAYHDPRFARWVDQTSGFTTRSIICVPLISKGRTLGVIELLNVAPFNLDAQHVELLQALSDFTAIAIENAAYVQRIKQLTIIDECTGLFNARHMYAVIGEEILRATRFKVPLSVIFLDLDHFKEVNDHHDHLVGTRLLREVGLVLRSTLRKIDTAFRYGGDEFVIVLPNTSLDAANLVAQRLRTALNERIFFKEQGLDIRITASFGVATFHDQATNKEDLVRAADHAMYKVKNSTRDGIDVADVPVAK